MKKLVFLVITVASRPYFSLQHYIWPTTMCYKADSCNHTWIPECGQDAKVKELRLFLDECDMYEVNCDKKRSFELRTFEDCFVFQTCPTCKPNCNLHKYHRRTGGDDGPNVPFLGPFFASVHLHIPSNFWTTLPTTIPDLPPHMLAGSRRYMGRPRRLYRPVTTVTYPKLTTGKKSTRKAVVLRRETVVKNHKRMMKVVKGYWHKDKTIDSSSYLE